MANPKTGQATVMIRPRMSRPLAFFLSLFSYYQETDEPAEPGEKDGQEPPGCGCRLCYLLRRRGRRLYTGCCRSCGSGS
jgi:hypothetical protein